MVPTSDRSPGDSKINGGFARTPSDKSARGSRGNALAARERPGDPKAQKVAPVAGLDPEAVRGAQAPRRIEPGAAAHHAPGTIFLQPGRAIRRRALVAVVPAVLDPFPHVARRIVQTELVGREAAHRSRLPL